VALYEHFGSEELTNLAAPIQARIPPGYVALNSEDARRLGVSDHDRVRVTLGDVALNLQARVRADFPRGAAGVPVGLPGIPATSAATCSVVKGG
jgi:NADH-quinone oxidoreductase subunit G